MKPIEQSVVDRATTAILEAILDGRYPSAARLAPERELARELDVSRVSVRHAIQRLVQWGVLVTRQGSGAVVQPRRRWTAHTLAGVLAHGLARGAWSEVLPVALDALALRRGLILDLVGRSAGRHPPGALDEARRLVQRAWDARHDSSRFLIVDRELLPSILEAAAMDPSAWLVNSLAEPYLAVMQAVVPRVPVPDSYRHRHVAVLDALERADGAQARAELSAYLDELDLAIVESLPDELRQQLLGN